MLARHGSREGDAMSPASRPSPTVPVQGVALGAGVRAVEEILCGEIAALQEAGIRKPRDLARPVHIVVPSRSLRLHVSALLVRRVGGALLGVRVQALDALARSLAEEAGAPLPPRALLPLLVRRYARAEPALAEQLDDLVGGYGPVEASVDHLLDAGFEAAHLEALEACLDAYNPGAAAARRARAVLQVAARLARALDAGAVDHGSRMLVRARERLEADPEAALPARAVYVHGFADATGAQADLIEALVRLRGARVLIDRPPDPGREEGGPARAAPLPDAAFGARFRERVATASGTCVSLEPPAALPAPRVERIQAPGPYAEVRAVADRLRRLLDEGAVPERIAVVARDLEGYALPLRQQLTRLGIPFSGHAARGPAGAAGRRLSALVDLLELGADASADRWLEAVAGLELSQSGTADRARHHPLSAPERADLRHALHQLGAARLGDVARIEWRGDALALSARRGLSAAAPGDPARSVRREVSGRWLSAARAAAAACCRRWNDWPEEAPLAAHLAQLRAWVASDLGWASATPGREALERALLGEEGDLPGDFTIDRGEFALLVRHALDGAGCVPLGGEGGGVQILTVMEARARSFDHLFVIGMNRGVFPRVIGEDPLLADDLRLALRVVLPDLPVKGEGVDEERHLFEQLASSSAEIGFSWHAADEDGKPRPASPLLERLSRGAHMPEPLIAPALVGARADDSAPRPAHEHALRVGLSGARAAFARVLPAAFEEIGTGRVLASDPTHRARARLAVLNELDPTGAAADAPGPYLGLIGAPREAGDPRSAPLYVTAVEQLARCPWRAFLTRLLRVEPAPDAHGELPSASDALSIGTVVHAVLEAITRRGLPEAADPDVPFAARATHAVAWPPDAEFESILARCAAAEARERGISLPGHARVLALCARPYLEVARRCDWSGAGGVVPVVGAEIASAVTVRDDAGAAREIRFRADRVDRIGATLRFTDYKTGKPIAEQKRPDARAEMLRKKVARGEALQAVAYALSEATHDADAPTPSNAQQEISLRAQAPPPSTPKAAKPPAKPEAAKPPVNPKAAEPPLEPVGRYLFLRPDLADEVRVLDAQATAELAEPFGRAVRTALAAWDAGVLLPRLDLPDDGGEPLTCQSCDVKEACLRGDSGVRQRMLRWLERELGAADLSPAARIFALAGETP
jgi:hypothetical protein